MARRPSAWVCRGALISAHRGARRGAPASAGPLCSLWSQLAWLLSMSLSPPTAADRLPSLPSLLERRGAVPRQAGGEPEQPQQLPAAKPS